MTLKVTKKGLDMTLKGHLSIKLYLPLRLWYGYKKCFCLQAGADVIDGVDMPNTLLGFFRHHLYAMLAFILEPGKSVLTGCNSYGLYAFTFAGKFLIHFGYCPTEYWLLWFPSGTFVMFLVY